jgi:uncharacterized protein with HEPN domain
LKKNKLYLGHINDEVNYLLKRSENLTYEEFLNNEDLIRSFTKSLEIIGEASKNITISLRKKYPAIEWKEIAGLRDILVHRYFSVNYKIIWDIIRNKLPDLKKKLKEILDEIDETNGNLHLV